MMRCHFMKSTKILYVYIQPKTSINRIDGKADDKIARNYNVLFSILLFIPKIILQNSKNKKTSILAGKMNPIDM